MRDIFCVPHAIRNDYGVFSFEERFYQLLETIESIKLYAPNSDIVLVDASEDLLEEKYLEVLTKIVNKIIFLYDDKYIQFLKYNSKDPSENKFEKKSTGEIQSMLAFLEFLKTHPIKYKRVFKLSGRYKLTSNFNLSHHYNQTNKCVFLTKEDWFGELVFRIRLWSFDYNNLFNISHLFKIIQQHTYNSVAQTTKFPLVEFSITNFIEEFKIPYTTVEKIGVFGLSGVNSTVIDE